MGEIDANFDQGMSKYSYPNGPITGCGVTINGILEVDINNSKTVDKPFMDKIYQIFDSKASRMGIKEVPVVFMYQDNPVPLDKVEPVVKETTNLSVSGEKSTVELNISNSNDSNSLNSKNSNVNNSGGDKSSKINLAPGFELLGSLTCLFVVWKLRKK